MSFQAYSFAALVILSSLQNTCAFLSHIANHDPIRRSCSIRHATVVEYQSQPPVRNIAFVSPLLDEGYPRVVEEFQNGTIGEKPLLLYLPGFDGTWVAPFLQFPELSTIFDVRCLTMGMDDRSTFDELARDVVDYIRQQVGHEPRTSTSNDENRTTLDQSTFLSSPGGSDDDSNTTNNVTDELTKQGEAQSAEADNATRNKMGSFFHNLFTGKQSSEQSKRPSRSVYLMGESFGGILASEVALTLLLKEDGQAEQPVNLKGLVLINSATCYDRSRFASEAIKIARLPELLYPFGLMTLIPLFADEYAWPQLSLMLQSKALPSVIDSAEREAYMGRVAFSLPQKLKYMSQGTLEWRLTEWLDVGCARVASRLRDFASLKRFRALIVAGEKDLTLPSIAEAERLSSILPNCNVHVVEGAGHANTCGSRVDLAALMRRRFDELKNKGKRGKKRGRTAMKPEAAANGTGIYFGMEKRYNGLEEGLSPLMYWSRSLFRRPPKERARLK